MSNGNYLTVWKNFAQIVDQFPSREIFEKISFNSTKIEGKDKISLSELKEEAEKIASYLTEKEIGKEDQIVIMGSPSSNWIKLFLAIIKIGGIAIPVSTTLKIPVLKKIFKKISPSAIFFKKRNVTEKQKEWLRKKSDTVLSFSKISKIKSQSGSPTCKDTKKIAAAILTSGTTSDPKVVALTHTNFSSNIRAIINRISISEKDVFFSIADWDHVFPFTSTLLIPLYTGAKIVYCPRKKGESIKAAAQYSNPTLFFGVPKFYNILRDRIRTSKIARLSLDYKIPLLPKLIGHKLKKAFGGDIRFFFSGAAPLCKKTLVFFEKIGVLLIEGYGMSEASPVIAVNYLYKQKKKSVGPVLGNISYEIRNKNRNGIGELVVKGPSIFNGYLTKEGLKNKNFDKDGFFHTKDLVEEDEEGFIFIKGRKGSMIAFSSGENVYPEQLQTKLGTIKEIENILILPEKKERIILKALIHPINNKKETKETIRRKIKDRMNSEPNYLKIRKIEFQSEGFIETSTGKIKTKHYS